MARQPRQSSPVTPPASSGTGGFPGRIRIIGGRWRGRRLEVPEVEGLRPTPDRVRETVFNWLAPTIVGARCMDLFAGSGALCLEALSRGAKEVVMVEKSSLAIRSLRENVDRLDAANVRIIDQDALDVLNRRYAELARPEAFDVIFVDPPFRAGLIDPVIQAIEQGGWLKPGGLLYVEAPSTTKNPPLSAVWEKYRSKTTGQVGYHLFYYHP